MSRRHVMCSAVLLSAPILLPSLALTQTSGVGGSGTPAAVQIFPLDDPRDLISSQAKASAVLYNGRKGVRIALEGQQQFNGLTLLRGAEFADGTIDVDVALKVTSPPGVRNPGFIGIGFRARQDANHYELFYLRPGDSVSDDQLHRNHSVQYASKPDFDFFKLRRPWPSVYEAYADMQPEAWTHIKIDVQGRVARLYVNGAAHPTLVTDGLKGEDLSGGVGLWASAGQENYFSNLQITHAARLPVENGGDAAGTWDVTYATDFGNYSGVLALHRDGASVSGTASGLIGSGAPAAGTWRNGYVELTLQGTWSGPGGNPGAATASVVGWFDGATAKGRVSVTGRADGTWTATRK